MKKTCIKAAVIAGITAAILSSCATTKSTLTTADNLSSVYVTNTNKVKLLSPEYMDKEIDALYVFSADFGKQSMSALSYFFADSEEMNLLLLSDFGIEIGSLRYDGKTLDFSMAAAGGAIKGEYIACDLENIFYPAQYLEEHYAASSLIFESSDEDGADVTRTISTGKKTVEKITMTLTEDGIPDEVTLVNYLRGYSYKLKLTEE